MEMGLNRKLKINKHFTPCLIDDEDEMYLAYIEYWNCKLKELMKRSKSC